VEAGELARFCTERYAAWDGDLGQRILTGDMKLSDVAEYAFVQDLRPRPVSGRQEWLENRVNDAIFGRVA
jgi:xylose isomerase